MKLRKTDTIIVNVFFFSFIIKMDESFDSHGHKCIILEMLDQSLSDLLVRLS